MGDTKIQWTGKTWNPIRARNKQTGKVGWFCEHVSEGCRNCYAEKMNRNTYFGNGLDYKPAELDNVELFLDEKILEQPLHWRKPTAIFPCSMTDLFGRWVKDEWLDQIFAVMAQAPQHTFQVLTKRAERMHEYMTAYINGKRKIGDALGDRDSIGARLVIAKYGFGIDISKHERNEPPYKPPQHVWLGVSVEDQNIADERIPLLMKTPAAVKFISVEPLLGPIDLEMLTDGPDDGGGWIYRHWNALEGSNWCDCHDFIHPIGSSPVDWVIVGGESGPKARPFDLAWGRSIVDQCKAAGVPVFVKQLGGNPIDKGEPLILEDKKGGNIEEWPVDLRVREFPSAVIAEAG